MTDAGRRHQTRHSLHHAEPGAQDGNEGELLSADALARGPFQRRFHGCVLEGQFARGLVRDERRDLVHQFLEDLGRCRAIAQE